MAFYKTTYTLTVLSDREIIGWPIETAIYEVTHGEIMGNWDVETEEISGQEMVREVREQGSDPAFFGLREDGTLEWEEK